MYNNCMVDKPLFEPYDPSESYFSVSFPAPTDRYNDLELLSWLDNKDNIPGGWRVFKNQLWFFRKEDAALYALRWL